MQGMGASPEGNRPFLDVLPLDRTEEKVRIWQSRSDANESLGESFDFYVGPELFLGSWRNLDLNSKPRRDLPVCRRG